MRKIIIVITCFLGLLPFISHAQILHSESFSVILDTTKTIKGSIIPDFKFETQKENLIEFESISDLTYRFRNNALTFANKIELSKYGNENLLSGGYVYIEYRKIFEQQFTIEPFMQIHWSEAKGLAFKYAGGVYGRYRAVQTNSLGIYAGTGIFYEYEKWNYDGVMDYLKPTIINDVVSKDIKTGSYFSLFWISDYNFTFDFSAYHQSRFDQIFKSPRLALSTSVTYNFTEHLGLTFIYQNIYDFNPKVPIDKLFSRVISTIDISF